MYACTFSSDAALHRVSASRANPSCPSPAPHYARLARFHDWIYPHLARRPHQRNGHSIGNIGHINKHALPFFRAQEYSTNNLANLSYRGSLINSVVKLSPLTALSSLLLFAQRLFATLRLRPQQRLSLPAIRLGLLRQPKQFSPKAVWRRLAGLSPTTRACAPSSPPHAPASRPVNGVGFRQRPTSVRSPCLPFPFA